MHSRLDRPEPLMHVHLVLLRSLPQPQPYHFHDGRHDSEMPL
jgi:hypothetical protein